MKANKLPVLNDPIYGFIRVESKLLFDLLEHPYFQRLRRISQMGLSSLVYPGARHSRFEHALGAMHLMNKTVETLQRKHVAISDEEKEALAVAILLHDIGHGPFSHAIERTIFLGVNHEILSLGFMELLNKEFDGKLSLAISIYANKYRRKFMHQLVSSQLDIDRLDYLKRDSFYTGATEGNINSHRIIEMLNVVDDQVVVEENGLFSIEKFIMARRLMYWQVYLHKTGLVAELLLSNTIQYVRKIIKQGVAVSMTDDLMFFMSQDKLNPNSSAVLEQFSHLDDNDIYAALKQWQDHPDHILASFSKRLLNRDLMKMKYQKEPFTDFQIEKRKQKLSAAGFTEEYVTNFVFSNRISCKVYTNENPIKVLSQKGDVYALEDFSSLFDGKTFSTTEIKHYLCYPKSK